MTETYHKRFAFRRLPVILQEPEAWRRHLEESWQPFFQEPQADRGAREAITRHMPELLAEYDALVAVAQDWPGAAHWLGMYNIRPFWAGCSQSAVRKADRTTLIRNYDLGINDFMGYFRYEALEDGGWILGSDEVGWGYIDGLNDRGLAVSITFGGRFVAGEGFAVPVIVRYLLKTCATTAEGVAKLKALPHRLAQNLTLVDRSGETAVVYTSPDEGVIVAEGTVACTNHQGRVAVPRHAQFTRTVERLEHLERQGGALSIETFLQRPLYNTNFREHFGTMYTVEYDPVAGTAQYAWPDRRLLLTPESPETEFTVAFQGERV